MGAKDRKNPTVFESIAVDPLLPVDEICRTAQVSDMKRWTRRFIKPWIAILSLLLIRLVIIIKRILPFQFYSETVLNVLGVRFMRNFTSPETLLIVLRHFAIETSLINFLVRNSGADDVEESDLMPTNVEGLGKSTNHQNSIIHHDCNIFNLFIDLGHSKTADVHNQLPLDKIDFSSLDLPEFDIQENRKRLVNLDLETSIYIMIFFIALFSTEDVTERAVNSFQLDESLLSGIANLTGDPVYRSWVPLKFSNWLGFPADPGRDLYWHMMVLEYAHHRLSKLKTSQNK